MKTKNSLIQQAKSVGRNTTKNLDITDEHYDLALAVVRGEVTLSQATFALRVTSGNTYSVLLKILSVGVKTGEITLARKGQ